MLAQAPVRSKKSAKVVLRENEYMPLKETHLYLRCNISRWAVRF